MVASYLAKYLLNNVLNRLLSMVRALTLMTHMMLIDVWYPDNVQRFFSQIFVLMSFDVIPTEYFVPQIFGFREEPPLSDQYDELGYSARNIVINLGSIFLFSVIQPILVAIYTTVRKFDILPIKCVRKWANRQLVDAYWNDLLTFLNEPYIVITTCAFIHAVSGHMFEPGDKSSLVFSDVYNVTALVVILVFPVAVLWIYCFQMKYNRP